MVLVEFEWILASSSEAFEVQGSEVQSVSEKEKRIENWKEKQMYGQFIADIPEGTDKEKSWLRSRKYDLKISSETLVCAAQEQAIRANYV